LTQIQVDGYNAILTTGTTAPLSDPRWLAYALATASTNETGVGIDSKTCPGEGFVRLTKAPSKQ
jgi:hypothetical protein